MRDGIYLKKGDFFIWMKDKILGQNGIHWSSRMIKWASSSPSIASCSSRRGIVYQDRGATLVLAMTNDTPIYFASSYSLRM